jgi:hypothetical protein
MLHHPWGNTIWLKKKPDIKEEKKIRVLEHE